MECFVCGRNEDEIKMMNKSFIDGIDKELETLNEKKQNLEQKIKEGKFTQEIDKKHLETDFGKTKKRIKNIKQQKELVNKILSIKLVNKDINVCAKCISKINEINEEKWHEIQTDNIDKYFEFLIKSIHKSFGIDIKTMAEKIKENEFHMQNELYPFDDELYPFYGYKKSSIYESIHRAVFADIMASLKIEEKVQDSDPDKLIKKYFGK